MNLSAICKKAGEINAEKYPDFEWSGPEKRKYRKAGAGFLHGATSAGHTVQEFYLDGMNIHSCKGCLRAGRDSKSPCSQKDDMEQI